MEKRHIKQFGKNISLLGFGAMRLPLLDPQKPAEIDYPLAEAMVDKAVASGVNYFDTAFMYHQGKSEVFLGHALAKYPRDSFYLADKIPVWMMKSPDDCHSIFDKQLSRCKVSHFDFYLVHSLTKEYYPVFKKYNVYEMLRKKKEEGLITHLGFSFHDTAELLEKILAEDEWDFAQIQLNYIDWDAGNAKKLYSILDERHLPVNIMEPVRGGALATLTDASAAILQKAGPGASTASWAIRYAASLPRVMTVLSGMSSLEQVEDNIKTMTGFTPLAESERAVLAEAAAVYNAAGAIGCTGCRYCIPCPAGLPARVALEQENIFVMTEDRAVAQDIRPIRIAIVNLMPTKMATEIQLLRLLGNTPLQIDITLLRAENHISRNVSSEYLERFYTTFAQVKDTKFDGMIITGAPVELLAFEEVDYWRELQDIMDYSAENAFSTLCICWAAQAVLYHHYGIPKHALPEKKFGVFEHTIRKQHKKIFRGFNDTFSLIHSRHTEVRGEDIAACPRLEVLAESAEAGVAIIRAKERRAIFVTGHFEYDADTLAKEYWRDKDKGLDIKVPAHYFPDDDPGKTPVVSWRAPAHLFFSNWLNYHVYQETPFEISNILPGVQPD
ncbi:hypothetical protein FACS1894168_2290 [Deltaproteobacteria bacterium]|nr:hypothetical protein FACS1894168_2290 [Deltaproteobacteria bacterium]